jgi:hypothetical protein
MDHMSITNQFVAQNDLHSAKINTGRLKINMVDQEVNK